MSTRRYLYAKKLYLLVEERLQSTWQAAKLSSIRTMVVIQTSRSDRMYVGRTVEKSTRLPALTLGNVQCDSEVKLLRHGGQNGRPDRSIADSCLLHLTQASSAIRIRVPCLLLCVD